MIHFSKDTLYALAFVRQIVMVLPGVTEQLCFETPAFYVNKKIFARLKENGESLVLYNDERERWMSKDPETYFITPHYKNYKYMLVNLERVKPDDLKKLLKEAWLKRAPKNLINSL